MKLVKENRMYFIYGKVECPECHGKGRTNNNNCERCNGTGYISVTDAKKTLKDYKTVIPGGIENGFDEGKLNKLYDQMEKFGEYAFNRSHSAAYAVIAEQTAYMKTYYPIEFIASVISFAENKEEIGFYVNHAKSLGIRVLAPDVNKSDYLCTVEDGNIIRMGLQMIKGVGGGAKFVIEERNEHGPFESLQDLYDRVDRQKVNKSKMKSLILAGCFKGIEPDKNVHEIFNYYLDIKGEKNAEDEKLNTKVTRQDLIAYEVDLFGTKVEQCSAFEKKSNGSIVQITGNVKAFKVIQDKKQRDMAFVTIETPEDEIECVVFATKYKACSNALTEGIKVTARGKKDSNKILIDSLKAS